MPRTKLGDMYSKPKEPPIDWLKAAILERMDCKGYNLKKLSAACGIEYEALRWIMRKPPMDWKRPQREAVCKALGIEIMVTVLGQPQIPQQ